MIKAGTNWGGQYTRLSYETTSAELKRYFALLKEKSKAVLDDDFNFAQDAILTQLRRSVADIFGSGSPNNGLKIVGTSANNDFTITGGNGTVDGAGVFYVQGIRVILPSNTTYLTQEVAGPVLAPPGAGTRTDTVYVDVWFDEVDPVADSSMLDPTLLVETSRRLKLKYMVRVAAGAGTPANYTDANGIPHYTATLATILRTTSNAIDAGMVTDARQILYPGATVQRTRDSIKYVIEQASIVYNEADNTQLRLAILNMVSSANAAIIISGATFEASVVNGEMVRWDSANSRFDEAVADGTANNRAVGVADVTNSKVYCFGETPALFSGLSPGTRYYLDPTTGGAVTSTQPSDSVQVGIAKSATVMFIDIDSGLDYARKTAAQSFTAGQAVTPVPLTDAATINTDAALGNSFKVTLNVAGATRALANPTNMRDGQVLRWRITQDAAGSRAMTYGSKFKWAGGAAPALSTAANARDIITGTYWADLDVIDATMAKAFG